MRIKRVGNQRSRRTTAFAPSILAVLSALVATSGKAQQRPVPDPPSRLVESIEVAGNHRTPASRVRPLLPFRTGEPATQEALRDGERILEQMLFRAVDVRTRPGTAPGSIVVTYDVQERRPDLRIGAGYDDLSGWYLIPLQLNLDNVTGHAEALRLSARLGYRTAGLVLDLRHPGAHERAGWWSARVRGESVDRIYFLDRSEVVHRVERGGLDLEAGWRLDKQWRVSGTLTTDRVDATRAPEYYRDDPVNQHDQGDLVVADSVPADIRAVMLKQRQFRAGFGILLDSRRSAELLRRGFWGTGRAEWVRSDPRSFPALNADLRLYLPLRGGLQAAGRVHAATRGKDAPFFDRLYLGGLYSVRGYASQSLSPPGGDLHLVAGSVELRSRWLGSDESPRLAGLVFLDAGMAWSDGAPKLSEGAGSIGYGFRIRLPWVRYVGIDVAAPLGGSVTEDAFRVHGSLGWTF